MEILAAPTFALGGLASLVTTYRHAWIAALLIAAGCSIVAVYVVLRRVAFIGIATAQVAAAGVALALLLNFPPLPAAAAATLLGVALFALGREPVRVSREGLVGVAFALASALAVLFVFRSSTELDHIEHIIYGSLLFTTPSQVWLLAAGCTVVLAVHALLAKEFVMTSFDPDTARTLGVKTRLFDLVLFATIGAMIALSIGAAGSLLTFALLVLPPLTALLLADRLPAVFALSLAAALAAVTLGIVVSLLFDLPPGPTIVVMATALLVVAALARVRRSLGGVALALLLGGVAAAALRQTEAPAPFAGARAGALHVDVEIAAHDRSVRRGARLAVDYVARIRGSDPEGASELYVLVNLESALASAKIAPGPHAGHLEIDTAELQPGRYRLAAAVWTGPPLDPTPATRLLDGEECSSNEIEVEVRP